MATSVFTITLLAWFINIPRTTSANQEAKVFMVLMEDEPVVTMSSLRGSEDIAMYKKRMTEEHDVFLESVLEEGSYIKLYSYTHLLNGFAIYAKTEEEIVKQGS
ncbi:UNVERIFIED_CONTAM: Subtilisin-like protease SBT2.5 [Sesamum latifolium]|uniref:Subtilisin-like protease SBT2.5 n=1 Tax=Sesamum latifolium TaxID=2727402 RepID=A0AAW2WZP8_9LAMI